MCLYSKDKGLIKGLYKGLYKGINKGLYKGVALFDTQES